MSQKEKLIISFVDEVNALLGSNFGKTKKERFNLKRKNRFAERKPNRVKN